MNKYNIKSFTFVFHILGVQSSFTNAQLFMIRHPYDYLQFITITIIRKINIVYINHLNCYLGILPPKRYCNKHLILRDKNCIHYGTCLHPKEYPHAQYVWSITLNCIIYNYNDNRMLEWNETQVIRLLIIYRIYTLSVRTAIHCSGDTLILYI